MGSKPAHQWGVQADREIPAESVVLELDVVVVLEPEPPVVVDVDEPCVVDVPLSVATQPALGMPAACATDPAIMFAKAASDFCCRSLANFCMQPANASVPGLKPKPEHWAVSALRSSSGLAQLPSENIAAVSKTAHRLPHVLIIFAPFNSTRTFGRVPLLGACVAAKGCHHRKDSVSFLDITCNIYNASATQHRKRSEALNTSREPYG
jgi:hypothetical protein